MAHDGHDSHSVARPRLFAGVSGRMATAMRFPEPWPGPASVRAVMVDYAAPLVRLHRRIVKTTWFIVMAEVQTEAEAEAHPALRLYREGAGLLEIELPPPADFAAGLNTILQTRLTQIGTDANGLRCVIFDEPCNGELAEIAFAAFCLRQALGRRLAPHTPAPSMSLLPYGASAAGWRKRHPEWRLLADGWIMRTL